MSDEISTAKYNHEFSRAIIQLLNKSVLCSEVSEDAKSFKFIKNNQTNVADYLSHMNLSLIVRPVEKTITVRKLNDDNICFSKVHWSNPELCIFIILRDRFITGYDISTGNATITRKEILDRLPNWLHNPKNFTYKKYEDIMQKFKDHDLATFDSQDMDQEDSVITIFPSIAYITDDDGVKQQYERLKKEVEEYYANKDADSDDNDQKFSDDDTEEEGED